MNDSSSMTVRARLAFQAGGWAVVSCLFAPVVVQFVYSGYLQLRFPDTGITLTQEFSIDLRYYFLQWLCVTIPSVLVTSILVLSWPRLSNWPFVIVSTCLVASSVVWCLWVLTSIVALTQSSYVLAVSLVSLLTPRLAIPFLWPSAALAGRRNSSGT